MVASSQGVEMVILKSGIYAFLNIETGYRYIGQSRNLENRRKEHIRSLVRGDHHSRYLQRSASMHGVDALVYSVLEYCSAEMLTEREQYWLDFYRPTGIYNSAPVADSNAGVVWSDEARALRSESQRGRVHTPEAKEKIGAAHKGRKFSDAHLENMRLTRLGKRHTDESRAKMSASRKGRAFTEQHIANMTASKIGRKHTAESIAKMRAAKLGKKHTEESKAKIAAAGVGRVRSADANRKAIETRMRNKALREQSQPT